jgi:hypothetical protein
MYCQTNIKLSMLACINKLVQKLRLRFIEFLVLIIEYIFATTPDLKHVFNKNLWNLKDQAKQLNVVKLTEHNNIYN